MVGKLKRVLIILKERVNNARSFLCNKLKIKVSKIIHRITQNLFQT